MELSENALKVLKKRYLARDEQGNTIETPEDLFRRVADSVAGADTLYDENADVRACSDEFYSLMTSLQFLPNSPTLMNAGRPLQQLSACFVIPIEDSMESIFEAVKDAALIHKSGGGTGFSFSRLRPRGDRVHSTDGTASGPVSFMSVIDASTGVITQGGKRRGANMGILRVDHPDISEFIRCKDEEGSFTNFNISVAVTDEFMTAVKNDDHFKFINPRTNVDEGEMRAKTISNMITEQAWKNGEPGVIFIDTINEKNPTPRWGKMESTNPCGEQPLLPYESCNLGSINMAKMIKEEGDQPEIDWEKLERVIINAVHFLDNVIDVNRFPLQKIEEMTKKTRKIGLGIMGWADLLIRLHIPYDSPGAITLASQVMQFIQETSHEASQRLAEQRGSFPLIEHSVYEHPMRNATTTTIAPTGSLSIIADCSSGIEPLYALVYSRKAVDTELMVGNPSFINLAKQEGFYSEQLMKEIFHNGTVQDNPRVPPHIQRIVKTALEINYSWHIKMQAIFQEYTDNAVSKTVNLPHSATQEDIGQVIFLAYESGCKGVTIYRDGSRTEQVYSRGRKPRKRPETMRGTTTKFKVGNCGNLYVTVNQDDQGVCEVFVNIGGEGCPPLSEAVGRVISLALRSGVEVDAVLKQIKDIKCTGCVADEATMVLSCPAAIAQAIEKQVKGISRYTPKKGAEPHFADICPLCSGIMHQVEGCSVCEACGYTQCE
jgi:ribonucleoside-diphosphate reductase alpha chain